MTWLLVFVFVGSAGIDTTTERFSTEVECAAVGRFIADMTKAFGPIRGSTFWSCFPTSAETTKPPRPAAESDRTGR